jgi:ribosome-associated protein YbcJ (S4-like RNA binding protein)
VRLGAENQKKAIAAGALFLVAIVMFIRMIAGNTSGSASAASTTPAPLPANTAQPRGTHRTARKVANTKGEKAGPLTPSLDPRLHLELLAESEDMEYKGNGRNLFDLGAPDPVPVAEAPATKQQVAVVRPEPPPPPPPPPPINLKFYGFTSSGGVKKVFLSQGDDVFVASEGDIVQRRYKIMKINNNNVEVLDVLSNNRQAIPLTAG